MTAAVSQARPWRRFVGVAFALVAFLILGRMVVGGVGELRVHQWEVRPLLLAGSLALHIAGLVLGVAVWQQLLRQIGYRIPLVGLARVWFISNLGRYIPGKIWQFVGAAHLSPAAGLPAAVAVTSIAANMLIFLIGAALIAAILLPTSALGFAGPGLAAARWASPLLLLLVHPAVFRTLLRILQRFTKRVSDTAWEGSWMGAVGLVALACVNWLVTGTALYLFIQSLTPIPASALLPVVGMNALSFLVGYAVFIAPAGLGAKEWTLTALLAIYLTQPVAALIAIATRLWTIAAEILPALALVRGTRATSRESTFPTSPVENPNL